MFIENELLEIDDYLLKSIFDPKIFELFTLNYYLLVYEWICKYVSVYNH